MSTDRELLEMAAKAAGICIECEIERVVGQPGHFSGGYSIHNNLGGSSLWNPLTDDGDALRLAVKLGIDVYADVPSDRPGAPNCAEAQRGSILIIEDFEDHSGDIYAATRRAIVRAAVEIGRAIP